MKIKVNGEKLKELREGQRLAVIIDKDNKEVDEFDEFIFIGFDGDKAFTIPQTDIGTMAYSISIIENIITNFIGSLPEKEQKETLKRLENFAKDVNKSKEEGDDDDD